MKGRTELAMRVQAVLSLPTQNDAEHVVNAVIQSLEATLLNNLATNGFALKLGHFGKFSVRHKPGVLRKIGFSGQTIQTHARRKIIFVGLGAFRKYERVG
jgi:nucleoid DNA-binding protein